MFHVFSIPVFYAKFINHQGEIYLLVLVCPNYWSDLGWYALVGAETFLGRPVGNDTHRSYLSLIYWGIRLMVIL